MAWLAVDEDGMECAYSSKPVWEEYQWTPWEEGCNYVILPKGSIEKLIGKKLTWEDGAVEVK